MNISRFFIERPIFAGVLSIVIFVAGAIAIPLLPISEYPEVVPPTVVVRAVYPGANPKTISETVAAPLEQANAELRLQFQNLPVDRGRRDIELFRRAADRADAGDLIEII